uniref:NADH dehydrogenase subunit 4L n=1 Tax=Camponotus japonicus TaxID=84547 RepID=UPI001EF9F76B|nr:NADH dehydrogenase subunit 4L [Camponotus japonicus]UHM24989.1 NADH dehydrogenase subunit 4L [Camponotus japonicus]
MIMNDLIVYVYLCMMVFVSLIFMYKFMLVVLMVFEVVILNLSMIMYLIYSTLNLDLFMVYYLVFMVCESTLGLSLLVLIVRYHGNELYYMFNISKF